MGILQALKILFKSTVYVGILFRRWSFVIWVVEPARLAAIFSRTLALPDDVDPAQVNANYRDGVLQISIARRESAQPTRITVQ